MDTINMEIARAKRYGKEFGLLYLDIDNFKQINDSRGHQLGDKLLKEMTRRMRGVLRESDVLGRMGAMNSSSSFHQVMAQSRPNLWPTAFAIPCRSPGY